MPMAQEYTLDKAAQLRAHKRLATGLFLLMLVIYIASEWLSRGHKGAWIGYVKAFSEAAMVGALADWFAVTALFHHPLGLPIPHTNLIERGKQAIGANLGSFVVSNFLTPTTIRPYIGKISVSAPAAQWLSAEKNKRLLVSEGSLLIRDIINKMDDAAVAKFIARRGRGLLEELPLHTVAATALEYFLDKGGHEELITMLAGKLQAFIRENEEIVRARVKKESYFFIPSFVDNKLASKITTGLAGFLEEIAADKNHRLRHELSAQMYSFVHRLRTDENLAAEFRNLSVHLLAPEKLEQYAAAAWQSLKATLQQELGNERSAFTKYLSRNINELAQNLRENPSLQQKIDSWVRHTAYRYILRNGEQVGALISNTVGNWQGRELSRKLELEVGKDLQYIRINGTIVGGLVGLLIYALTQWIG
jgi:uncharacterized membrane-anchored protein YjiN (DUF445 family)